MKLEKIKKILCHPLTLAVVIFLIVHAFNITRFDFLSEKDSYGWLLKYQDDVKYNSLDDYRQLFSTLAVSLHYLTGISLYGIFKYLLPLLFSVVFIPLWLVARNLKSKYSQFLLLLAPLVSSTIILQMEATRPQIMAMIFLYFVLGVSMFGNKEKNWNFFFIVLGLLALIGSLFHRVFVIFLILWIISAIFSNLKLLLNNKMKLVVLTILAIPWLEKFEAKKMITLAFKSLYEIFDNILLHPNINFRFPAYYINIDGIQMGWNNLEGVAKYYAFYASPFLLALLGLILIFFVFFKKFRIYIKENTFKKEFLFVYLMILFFLFIAEFLPRIGNLAYLPDRAWVFLGILLILPLYFVLDFVEKNMKGGRLPIALAPLLVFLIISASGAVYMNSTFSNIIPNHKLESYEWIKNNVNPESVIFTPGYAGALKYHSGVDVSSISDEIFKGNDLSRLIDVLSFGNKSKFDDKAYKQNLNGLGGDIESVKVLFSQREYDYRDLSLLTRDMKRIASDMETQVNSSSAQDADKDVYIYISKDSEENPYQERNYETKYFSGLDQDDTKLLDDHPEYFEKIYDIEKVKIWKYFLRN